MTRPSTDSARLMGTGQPSRTALTMAIARAVHQLLDEPIVLDDPFALRVLGPGLAREVHDDPFRYNDPMARTLRAAVVARSMVAEHALACASASGVRRCVLLGAGLDTLALRAPHTDKGMRYLELDHPDTQAWKLALLREAGLSMPAHATLVGVDFQRQPLDAALRDAGLRDDDAACFIWLGVTPYLTEAAIEAVLANVAARPAGTSVVFDYRVDPAVLPPWEAMMSAQFAQQVAAMGEPWRSAWRPEQLSDRLLSLGFAHIDSFDAQALNARYFPRRKDGLQTVDGGLRLVTARVGV